jgi:hypothetical protein
LTSDRKIQANRANARASTGPKTAQGRARSTRNALRHGLSVPIDSDPLLFKEVQTLAREIVEADASAETLELARRVAEAQIEVRRVRYARHRMLSEALADPYFEPQANTRAKVALLKRLLQTSAPDLPEKVVVKLVTSTPQGPDKLAAILTQEASRLLAIDRYEQRALSRLKFAIRALDESRQATASDCNSQTRCAGSSGA